MAEQPIRMTLVIGASPERIYQAWLDSREHTSFTGGEANVDPRVGGTHTAWDGYIKGVNLELEPGRKVVQSWRSLDFPEGVPDSRLEVTLAPVDTGTQVTLTHSEIPDGQREDYEQGWRDYYFGPMKRYFEDGVRADAIPVEKTVEEAPRPKAKPKAKAKVKASAKAKPKAKAKPTKLKAKAKVKSKVKAKVKAKSASKAKAKSKPAAKAKPKARGKKSGARGRR